MKKLVLLFSFLLLNAAYANDVVYCPKVSELKYNEQEQHYYSYSDKQEFLWQSEETEILGEKEFMAASAEGDQRRSFVYENIACGYFVYDNQKQLDLKLMNLPNHMAFFVNSSWEWYLPGQAACMSMGSVKGCSFRKVYR